MDGHSIQPQRLPQEISAMRTKPYQNIFKNTLYCLDFEEFLEAHQPSHGRFYFVDPPYDSDFSTYTKNPFGREEQIRLASYFTSLPSTFYAGD